MSNTTTTSPTPSPTLSSDLSIFPTPTSSSNSSSTPNSNSSPPSQSSSLYLFTFLATLLLLLAVSCAIVVRSFILRRRFRRRIEEAIAAGVLAPGALDDGPGGGGMGRGRRRDFGEKPKLWEVWVDEHGQEHTFAQEGSSKRDSLGKGEGRWEEILPVSATVLSSNTPKPIPLPGSGSATSLLTSEHQNARRLFISRILGRRPFTRSSPPAPTQTTQREGDDSESRSHMTYPPIAAKDPEKEDEKLQVSVLISMPSPSSRRTYGSDVGGPGSVKGKEKGPGVDGADGDGEMPDVVFGVAEVDFRS